jgi:hypothetical protein
MNANQFDVVIAGATPAGICAAIAVSRRGLRAALVDPLPVPGQMLSNGLCVFDTAHRAGVVGIMSEFAARVAAYHRKHYGEQACVRDNLGAPRHGAADGLSFEPKIAALILREMIDEARGISYFPFHRLTGAIMDGTRCVGIRCQNIMRERFDPRWAVCPEEGADGEGIEFRGRVVIDATYEGDIAAWAGVPYAVGREARSRLEPHNGVIMSDYFTGTAAREAGWLPETFCAGSTGVADKKVMAYNVRYIVRNHGQKEGAHRLQRPANYDPGKFKRWMRLRDGGYLPNGKQFVNVMNGGNDMQGELLSTYPDGTPEQRRKVINALYDLAYQHLYFLQTEMDNETWGLAEDEFGLNGGWPYCVYVREARRIDGMRKLAECDLHRWLPRAGDDYFTGIPGDRSRPALQRESVAVGDYDMDCHPCDNEPSPDYPFSGEGGFMLSSVRAPFQVPYGCMVPREIEGLLVTCAISASHMAMCAVRMEPVWSQLGQAAGVAAALSCRERRSLQEIEPGSIQAEQIKDGCQLYYYMDVPPGHPGFAAIQRLTLRGAAGGYADWTYRPDRLLTRGEWAQMLAASFDLWPSVTAKHFDDVSPDHPAFVAIETLYDHGARRGIPIVPFEGRQKVWCDDNLGYLFFAHPAADITAKEAWSMLRGVMHAISPDPSSEESETETAVENAAGFITRAQGALLLDKWAQRQGNLEARA